MIQYNSAVRLLDEAVLIRPEKTAVRDEWGEITYADLCEYGKEWERF